MSIIGMCNRNVVVTYPSSSIIEAARAMREHHVGDLVVVQDRAGVRIPVGMITDRDIVVEMIAKEVPLDAATVGDIMSVELSSVHEDAGLRETLQLMRTKAIRRLPVVDGAGALVGILSFDDVLQRLAGELVELANIPFRQQDTEQRSRR